MTADLEEKTDVLRATVSGLQWLEQRYGALMQGPENSLMIYDFNKDGAESLTYLYH